MYKSFRKLFKRSAKTRANYVKIDKRKIECFVVALSETARRVSLDRDSLHIDGKPLPLEKRMKNLAPLIAPDSELVALSDTLFTTHPARLAKLLLTSREKAIYAVELGKDRLNEEAAEQVIQQARQTLAIEMPEPFPRIKATLSAAANPGRKSDAPTDTPIEQIRNIFEERNLIQEGDDDFALVEKVNQYINDHTLCDKEVSEKIKQINELLGSKGIKLADTTDFESFISSLSQWINRMPEPDPNPDPHLHPHLHPQTALLKSLSDKTSKKQNEQSSSNEKTTTALEAADQLSGAISETALPIAQDQLSQPSLQPGKIESDDRNSNSENYRLLRNIQSVALELYEDISKGGYLFLSSTHESHNDEAEYTQSAKQWCEKLKGIHYNEPNLKTRIKDIVLEELNNPNSWLCSLCYLQAYSKLSFFPNESNAQEGSIYIKADRINSIYSHIEALFNKLKLSIILPGLFTEEISHEDSHYEKCDGERNSRLAGFVPQAEIQAKNARCKTGEDVIKDIIALGYAQINENGEKTVIAKTKVLTKI